MKSTQRSLPKALLIGQTALLLGLSACVSSGGVATGTAPSPDVRRPVRAPIPPPVRDPEFHMEPGLEGVIGATQAQLSGQFGSPRLDVWEGDARKLQFTGTPCILDVYLYPTKASREPRAAYVDARRSDGRDVDKASCVRALRR